MNGGGSQWRKCKAGKSRENLANLQHYNTAIVCKSNTTTTTTTTTTTWLAGHFEERAKVTLHRVLGVVLNDPYFIWDSFYLVTCRPSKITSSMKISVIMI